MFIVALCLGGLVFVLALCLILQDRKHKSMTNMKNLELNQISKEYAILREQKMQIDLEHGSCVNAIKMYNVRLEEKNIQLEESKKLYGDIQKIVQNANAALIAQNREQALNESKSALEAILGPLKNEITNFKTTSMQGSESINILKGSLETQVKSMLEATQNVGNKADSLAQALLGKHVKWQGNWGEMVLNGILESAGLQEGVHYHKQKSVDNQDGQKSIPDVILNIGGGKSVIIDSKVSLVSYKNWCDSVDDVSKQVFEKDFMKSINSHIKDLSEKKYQNILEIDALDFTIMFVPIEPAYYLMLQKDPNLSVSAWNKKIILAGPYNLMGILNIVSMLWRMQNYSKNAEQIAKKSGEMYDKFVLFLDTVDSVDKSMSKSVEMLKKAKDQLYHGKGNLVRRAEEIRQLGARNTKEISSDISDLDTSNNEEFNLSN